MAWLEQSYESNIPELNKNYPGLTNEVYKGLQHFIGISNTKTYLEAYKQAIQKGVDWVMAHQTAQETLNQKITKDIGKTPPKNQTVLAYLTDLLK